MTEKPIGMTPSDIVAINEGRKTMTRRLVKPQPPSEKYQYTGLILNHEWHEWLTDLRHGHGLRYCAKAPFAIGTKLWVKEPHYRYGKWVKLVAKTKTGKQAWRFKPLSDGMGDDSEHYYNENDVPGMVYPNSYRHAGWYKRLAIFMPKDYTRTWLLVTEVKAPERIQDISPDDCVAEGINKQWAYSHRRPQFKALWESIYGDGSWDKNEWTWPIGFKKIEKE